MPGRVARTFNVILGVWLFFSAFLWTHSPADRVTDWSAGLLIVVFAVIAMTIPVVRRANSAVAVWLLFSAFALTHVHAATRWNEGLVALLVLTLSIVPTEEGTTTTGLGGEEQHAHA